MQALNQLRGTSLKEVFIERFEGLILSGKVSAGQVLPAERALALQLGVSRPVVHEGLVELATRGLVTVKPRVGTVVNDYRRDGSLALLTSLINYGKGALDPAFREGLLSLRRLLETETARLAARCRSAQDVRSLRAIVSCEDHVRQGDVAALVDLDFAFHHAIALASGNPIYAMFLKSFEPAQKNLARTFFGKRSVVAAVRSRHGELVGAITARDEDRAAAVMSAMLDHGERILHTALGASPDRK